MGRLVYSAIASLDGFVADAHGRFDWAEPDAEVHRAVNDLVRPVGTQLLGRRMYETLRVWDVLPIDDEPGEIGEFAEIWRGSDKVVYSRTLDGISLARARLEPEFDPDAVRRFVDESPSDVSVGGPTLAAVALAAGIVDELQLFSVPRIVGGGTPWLPADLDLPLQLVETRGFTNGTVLSRYSTDR